MSRSQRALIEDAKTRECELILSIATADDLVLGLLNKRKRQRIGVLLKVC